MLKHRLTLGPILIAGLIGIVWLDELVRARWDLPGLVFGALVLVAGVGAGRELAGVFRAGGIRSSTFITTLAIALGVVAMGAGPHVGAEVNRAALVAAAAALALATAMVYDSRGQSVNGAISSAAVTLLSFVYVGLLGGLFILILVEHSGWVVLGVLLATKSCDIGAYFTGSAIGRRKLIPWLSPGKTWEGLAGGVVTSAVVGAALAPLTANESIPLTLAWWEGALLGAVFGLVGQLGDLAASLLKRDAGVKDYAQTLPGFGGVMDVADSPLLVAPVAYWLLWMMGSSPAVAAGAGFP